MKISIFHYFIKKTNPAGSCVRLVVEALCEKYSIDVYAIQIDNSSKCNLNFYRILSPIKPLALLFIGYYIIAPLMYLFVKMINREKGLVIFTEARLPFGDIAYPHFCHRAYLNNYWQQNTVSGIKRFVKWLNHKVHAISERFIYPKVKVIVVPSQGLKREMLETYDLEESKIHVIQNPVDLEYFKKPEDFDKEKFIKSHNIQFTEGNTGVFVALGDFERKGLDLLLQSLAKTRDNFNLIVVGGNKKLISDYRKMVNYLDLSSRVIFVGMQQDIRTYLWAADVFIFPSMYEVFPLVSLQAAAAGLPLLVTKLYGVEEFMVPSVTGYIFDRNCDDITKTLDEFTKLECKERLAMGEAAKKSVEKYSTFNFKRNWLKLIEWHLSDRYL